MATRVRRSPWRSEVHAPPAYTDDHPEIFFGCRPWSAASDLAMGQQDPHTGLWSPGDQRLLDACPLCGGVPGANVYCAGCSAMSARMEDRLEADYQADIARERERLRREEEQRGTFAQRKYGRKADPAA